MKHNKFYLVWCEQGTVPAVKHDTHDQACSEAERLVHKEPHKVFHVMECVSTVKFVNIVWTGEQPLPF